VAQGKIIIKSDEQIELIRISCLLACEAIAEVVSHIKPGVSGKRLDKIAEEFINDKGGKPSFKGYGDPPFTGSLCLSVNDAVVHGLPSDKGFVEGDLISIDCGAFLNGFHGDVAYTVILGPPKPGSLELCVATKHSLQLAVDQCISGKRLGDIGFAVQQYIEKEKRFGVVRDLVGHGVGRDLHEAPDVPNHGKRGNGTVLKEGMVIAIEPMVNLGTRQVKTLHDHWTIVSKDGKVSAHYEHTVAIRKEQGQVLTDHRVIEESIKNNKDLSEISLKI
jgi:methionyl aminopeptidase